MGASSMRFALEQLPANLRKQAEEKLAAGKRTVVDGKAVANPPETRAERVRVVRMGKNPVEEETKYNARTWRENGLVFGSKLEYRVYLDLLKRQMAGEISGLRCQVRFSLFDPGGECRGEHIGTYRADFVYKEAGQLVVADAKSEYTRKLRDWPRTKKLMRACHGIEVKELS